MLLRNLKKILFQDGNLTNSENDSINVYARMEQIIVVEREGSKRSIDGLFFTKWTKDRFALSTRILTCSPVRNEERCLFLRLNDIGRGQTRPFFLDVCHFAPRGREMSDYEAGNDSRFAFRVAALNFSSPIVVSVSFFPVVDFATSQPTSIGRIMENAT